MTLRRVARWLVEKRPVARWWYVMLLAFLVVNEVDAFLHWLAQVVTSR